jgi:hypothetical protein
MVRTIDPETPQAQRILGCAPTGHRSEPLSVLFVVDELKPIALYVRPSMANNSSSGTTSGESRD